jgi:hypothetical protein
MLSRGIVAQPADSGQRIALGDFHSFFAPIIHLIDRSDNAIV